MNQINNNPDTKQKKKRRFYHGKYPVQNVSKYIGNPYDCTYRSSWERKLMLHLDESSTVISWGSEPFAIPYRSPVDNRMHKYYPDFIVKAKSSNDKYIITLIEVKPYAETNPPKSQGKRKERYIMEMETYLINQAKWKAAEELCKQKGWRFFVATEKNLGVV